MQVDYLSLLDSGSYVTYNRDVAKALGSIDTAIMLSELVNRYRYHEANGKLIEYQKYEGQWFYYTTEKCEERTALSEKKQRKAISELEAIGLLKKQNIGLPAKKHFQLNLEKIQEFVGFSKSKSITAKTPTLPSQKPNSDGFSAGLYNDKEPNKEPYSKNNNSCRPGLPAGGGKDATKGCFASPVSPIEKEEPLESEKWIEEQEEDKKVIDKAFKPYESNNSHQARESHPEGTKIDESMIYRAFASDQETTTSEIDEAIAIAKKNGGNVASPIDYIRAIVQNRRNAKGTKQKSEMKQKEETCKKPQKQEVKEPVNLVNFGEFRKNYKG